MFKHRVLNHVLTIMISLILIVNFTIGVYISADDAQNVCSPEAKISDELMKTLNSSEDEDRISVYVWFEDIDLDNINKTAEAAIGYSQDDIEKAENAIPAIDKNVFSLDDESLTEEFKKYAEATKGERHHILDMQNDLVLLQRQMAVAAYSKYNQTKIDDLKIPEDNIIYKSTLSPVVIAEMTKCDILQYVKCETIVSMDQYHRYEIKECMNYALNAIYAKYTRDTLGFDGYGVKIGMYDAGKVNTSHSDLSSAQITRLDSSSSLNTHATLVARILVGSNGLAPNAHLYSSSHSANSSGNYESDIEAIIAQGVYIINMSLGFGNRNGSVYTSFEKWIDHLANQHNVTMVISAGNDGVNAYVSNPGLAYNVITAGGTYTQFTSDRSDDTLYPGNAGNYGTSGCAKPDFLAPAAIQMSDLSASGTSISAPIITGVIAQMIEYKPTIGTKPALIKAILTSSTDKKVLPGTTANATTEAWAGPLTAQQGAGQINAKLCMYILGNGTYATGTMSSGTITKTFAVSSSDTFIRYSVAWLRPNTSTSDHGAGTANAAIAANLKLQGYKPNGTSVGSANATCSSVELLHFNTGGTTGTYSMKISRVDSGTNSFKYAVAWR